MRKQTTVTTELGTAIGEQIQDHGAEYIRDFSPRSVHFFYDDEVIEAGTCPAIGVLFRGFDREEDSVRGRNEDGTVAAGYALMNYRYEIQIWHKAAVRDTLNINLRSWGDAVTALFEDKFDLDNSNVSVNATAGNPTDELEIGGVFLAAMPIALNLKVFRLQGATTLP